MESALDTVFREMRARGGCRVHRIVLRIGALSGVEPEALRFAFEAVTPGTPAADAELEIENIPARAYCRRCAEEFSAPDSFVFACPKCGAPAGEFRTGRELELSRMEIS